MGRKIIKKILETRNFLPYLCRMETKEINIDGFVFKVSKNGRVWILRNGEEKEVGTGLNSLYKKYHVREINKSFYIHRLVAIAWIENPMNKTQVNHINRDRLDNRVENLEWVSDKENKRHRYGHKDYLSYNN